MSNPAEQFDLHQEISESENLALWIYWDSYYDCDQNAARRTLSRINQIETEHGEQTVWAICVNWAQVLCGTLREHFECIQEPMPPVSEILAASKYQGDDPENRAARAVVQFVSAIHYSDLEMSRAIFGAAHDSSREDAGTFVFVLLNAAEKVCREFDHDH